MLLGKKNVHKKIMLFWAIGIVYFLFCKFGLLITDINSQVASVWPASGAGFAILYIFGIKYAPALFFADLIANIIKPPITLSDPLISLFNIIAVVIAVFIFRKFSKNSEIFSSTKNMAFFLGVSSFVLSFIASTGGVFSIFIDGLYGESQFFNMYVSWFLADYSGLITIAPFFLTIMNPNNKINDRKYFFIIIAFISIVGFILFGFSYNSSLSYYPFPLFFTPVIVYASFKLSSYSVTLVILLIESLSIIGTASGFGPYASVEGSDPLIIMQIFIVVSAVTCLLLKTVVLERQLYIESLNEKNKELEVLNKKLEENVKERTDDLQNTLRHLEMTEELYKNIYDNAVEGILVADIDGKILQINDACANLFGYMEGSRLIDDINRRDGIFNDSEFFDDIMYSIKSKGYVKDFEFDFEINENKKVWLSLNAKKIDKNNDGVPKIMGILRNITKSKINEKKLMHHASHDDLTGLSNRFMFRVSFDRMLKLSQRNNQKLAVLYLDLDDFKNINDSFGHYVGDQLLIETSKRLTNILRESDLIARMGGDEFILVLFDVRELSYAEEITNKIIQALSKPFIIFGKECIVGASIGIAIFPDQANTPQELIKIADRSMYKAKELGKNQYYFEKN